MPSLHEARRIAAVYAQYEAERRGESHWAEANPGNRSILNERIAVTKRLLQMRGYFPLGSRRVLDVGCGGGGELARVVEWGADPAKLVGVELLPEFVDAAQRAHREIRFQCMNAERLDFPDGSFDLVMLFTIFSSILDEAMSGKVASEVTRVLSPGGGVLWYDMRYRNPWNSNIRPIGRAQLRSYFPDFAVHLETLTVLPPLARRLGPITLRAYPCLSRVPLLHSHYAGLLIKPR